MRGQASELAWWMAGAVLALGCANTDVERAVDGPGGFGGTGGMGGSSAVDGAGVGEACSEPSDCRTGLTCLGGFCELGHQTGEGEACIVSGECHDGLQCVAGICVEAGGSLVSESCQLDVDCASGLRCALVGMTLQCVVEGTLDLGAECSVSEDCYAGLACVEGVCVSVPAGTLPFQIPVWDGVACDEPTTGTVRAFFEVPGAAGGQPGDFFRLPFPNDVRMTDAHPDLSDFPSPGTGPGGVDLVRLYADAVAANADGWSAYPTVYFRFSGRFDFDTFKNDTGGTPPYFVDITQGADEYGENSGNYFGWDGNDRRYICHDYIAVRRPLGRPLLPGHTYAVWLSTNSRAADGSVMQRSPHLVAMLSDETPADPALARAHVAYAPLRAYLADTTINPPDADTILNAAVFTVGNVRDPMRELAAAVARASIPTSSSWVKCAAGVASPCPQAEGDRACGAGTADYDEYHALVPLPILQVGTAPYQQSGGQVDPSGAPRYEEVCLALTVPTSTMPAEGWPLVVYAHGTGGSFRWHLRDEVAGALARATTASGTRVPLAVLGIDQVQHGPRRGDSTASPNDLYANYANPAAALCRARPISWRSPGSSRGWSSRRQRAAGMPSRSIRTPSCSSGIPRAPPRAAWRCLTPTRTAPPCSAATARA